MRPRANTHTVKTVPASLEEYRFTNDRDMRLQYQVLKSLRASNVDNRRYTAILVGSGGLLSLADVLPDTVYVVDSEESMLAWVKQTVKAMIMQPTINTFLKSLRISRDDLGWEAKSFGDHHYSQSEVRYREARAAVGSKAISYVHMDLGDRAALESLGGEIASIGEQVSVLNATNVHEHMSTMDQLSYLRGLEMLPWAERYRIVCSMHGPGPAYIPPLPTVDDYRMFVEG